MAALAGVATSAGCCFGGVSPTMLTLRLGAAMVLLTAAGFVLNDLLDISKDRANTRKPLVSGEAAVPGAVSLYAILTLGAITLLAGAGWGAVGLGAAQMLVLAVYSSIKAHNGLAANVVTGLLCASCFLYGWLVVRTGWPYWWVAVCMTVLVTMGRELAKDLLDFDADAVAGSWTVPTALGARATALALLSVYACVVVTAAFYGFRVAPRSLLVLTPMCALLIGPASSLWLKPDSRWRLSLVLAANAAAMPMGLLAFTMAAAR
jgi:4-hydroxybenzoate polyprenyltransferase